MYLFFICLKLNICSLDPTKHLLGGEVAIAGNLKPEIENAVSFDLMSVFFLLC